MKLTDVNIVPMRCEHVAALAELEQLCFSQPWSQNSLEHALEDPLAFFCVAEQESAVLGYAGMYCIVPECDVTNVAVFPYARGKGVGTALVRALLDHAWSKGADVVTLEVRASNIAAQALYERLGFVSVGRRPGFYAAPKEDAVMMRQQRKEK